MDTAPNSKRGTRKDPRPGLSQSISYRIRHNDAVVLVRRFRCALLFLPDSIHAGSDISCGTWHYLLSLRQTLLCFIFHFAPVVVNWVRRMVETARAYLVSQMVH